MSVCICALKTLGESFFFSLSLSAVQVFKGSTFWQKYVKKKEKGKGAICSLPRVLQTLTKQATARRPCMVGVTVYVLEIKLPLA